MRIPGKIKVGGHWFRVIYPGNFSERGDLSAQCDYESKVIKICDKDSWSHEIRPESCIAVDFLHELLHAVDFASGHRVFKENEEAIIGISELLFQVIRDNGLDFREEKDAGKNKDI